MRSNWYVIGIGCFAVATVIGVVLLVAEKGHWSQVVIPLALLGMSVLLWWRARGIELRKGS
jgi:membrane protein implicated in regulation of membrane protease activity